MALVLLNDMRFKEYSLENLELLGSLRSLHFSQKSEICIERAKLLTEYYKNNSKDNDPPIIRRAMAIKHFLSNKVPVFHDDNLLAGTTTSKPMGAPLYPEFVALTIWPELETISSRKSNPQYLSKEDSDILNFEVYPYWMERNVLEVGRKKYSEPECMKLSEQFIFFIPGKAGCISHTVPNYEMILTKGINGIIKEAQQKEIDLSSKLSNTPEDIQKLYFYKAVQIVMEGLLNYAENLKEEAFVLGEREQDPVKKRNYKEMVKVLKNIPANPAKTFREAVNSIWLAHIAVHAENINMAISPGRLDQILYKYYRKDIDEGRLDIKGALELVGCLWLKFADNVNMVPESAEKLWGGAGTAPAVTLGGIDGDGEDAVNELTYVMLKVTELLKTRDPSMNARYNYEKNSKEYLKRVCEVISNTKAVPALHNDIADIKALENQGILTRHARDYAIIGCVELASSGKSYDDSSAAMLNLVAPLELALYNGRRPVVGDELISIDTGEPESFKTYEDFWQAYTTQLKWLIDHAITLDRYLGEVHKEVVTTPLLSALFEGPMTKGKDLVDGGGLYDSSGITHIGFADTVDSLNAIEKCVFIDKKYSLRELIDAVRNNFEENEVMRQYLVNKAPKYGTDDTVAINNSRRLIHFLYDTYKENNNSRGGKYRPAYWTMTNHAGQGALTYALPNGRKSGEPFASGITPCSGAARELSGCIHAVGGLDCLDIPGGEALNLKFTEIKSEDDLEKFASIVETYFRYGGMQVQFNIMSYEMLMDAKANPSKYPDLMVRVSGYSAYFKDLNEKMQEELIKRTEYDIKTGKYVPFPNS